jgi:histidine triad (HIT) family protein
VTGGPAQAAGSARAARVDGCVFCAIAAGDIPADIVQAGELALAFRDLHPVAPIHVLVIPRGHLDDATAVTSDHGAVLAEMVVLAREVAARDGIAESGYRLVMNVGPDSGNSVGHLHLHVLGGRALGALG